MLTVACVWIKSEVFDTIEWVWKLYRMVDRRIGLLHRPFEFVCITPHVDELKEYGWVRSVAPDVIPPKNVENHWYKVNLFNLEADQVLYFDLDVVIMKSIVPLIEFPSDFCTAPSSGVPMRGHDFNSSVMSWRPHSDQVKFIQGKLDKIPYIHHKGDQQWLSTLPIRVDLFPSKWISKYFPKASNSHPANGEIVSLLIQGGKNKQLIMDGHTWILDYWR
jgi:hypothetical protein